jgi:hypothetical protein
VCAERRAERTVFKLRFRDSHGRQIVRYIGNADCAEVVRAELKQLQGPRHLQLELAAVSRKARSMIREAKASLQPVLAGYGYVFHGQAIRRPRQPKSS